MKLFNQYSFSHFPPEADQPLAETNKAVALIMSLYIIIVFAIIGFVLTTIMASEYNTSNQQLVSLQALYVAEAGIQHAIASRLKWDDDWTDGTPANYNMTFHLSDGTTEVRFYITFNPSAAQSAQITSRGEADTTHVTPLANVTGKREVTITITAE